MLRAAGGDVVGLDGLSIAVSGHRGPFAAWNGEQLQMVKAVGGSPSWGLFEAAKGAFVYVNLWSQRRSDPFDLAAGATLLRAAGGDVVGLDGLSIAVSGHRGPFVAGIDASQRQSVLNLLA